MIIQIKNCNLMVLIHTHTDSKFTIGRDTDGNYTFSDWSFEWMLKISIFVETNQWFWTNLSCQNNIFFFMVINWKNVIVMLSKQFLLIILNIMLYQYSRCMVNYCVFIFVKKILAAVFWTVSEYILQCYAGIRFISSCFWVFISGLFYCTYPRFYCHKFITFVHCLSKILNLNWFWLFLEKIIGQVNIFIQVIETIVFFLKFITFVFIWRPSFNIPYNQCSIKTSNTYHFLISEFHFSDMGTVTVKNFKNLIRNVAWILEDFDCLIIISDC